MPLSAGARPVLVSKNKALNEYIRKGVSELLPRNLRRTEYVVKRICPDFYGEPVGVCRGQEQFREFLRKEILRVLLNDDGDQLARSISSPEHDPEVLLRLWDRYRVNDDADNQTEGELVEKIAAIIQSKQTTLLPLLLPFVCYEEYDKSNKDPSKNRFHHHAHDRREKLLEQCDQNVLREQLGQLLAMSGLTGKKEQRARNLLDELSQ